MKQFSSIGTIGTIVAVGAAAILIGGLWVACSSLESDNERKSDEIERRKKRHEEESRAREASLAQLEKAKDIQTRMAILRSVVKSASEAEKDAHRQWEEIKEYVAQLNCQMKSAFARKDALKRELREYKNQKIAAARGRFVDFENDEFVSAKVEEIRQLASFCKMIVERKRMGHEAKNASWEMMRQCNEQKQQALREMREFKEKVSYFVCAQCGHRFAMTAGELEFFDRKGLHPPKRCKACRTNRA